MQKIEVPRIPTWQLIYWTLGITAVIGAFWLVVRFQRVIPLLLAAIILSLALQPAIDRLEKRGLPRTISILLIFGLVGLLLGLLLWASIPLLGEQSSAIGQSLAEGYALLHERLQQMPNIIIQRLLRVLPAELPIALTGSEGAALNEADLPMPTTEGQGERLLSGLFQAAAIVILTFYWLVEGALIKQSLFLLVPLNKRAGLRRLVAEMEAKVSSYLLGQGILCVIVGVLAFIAYSLIGLPNALLLAFFAGLLEAVPIVGPFLGAVPAMMVGLSVSPTAALWVLLATGIIQQLENSFLVPRVMRQAIGVRPLVTLLALLAFGSLFGVLGGLIALPLAAVLQLLLDRYLLARESLAADQPGRDQHSLLRYETNQLVQDVRNQVRIKDGVPSDISDALEDELEAIALDLESYLAARCGGQL